MSNLNVDISKFHTPNLGHVTLFLRFTNCPSSVSSTISNIAVYGGLLNLFNKKSSISSKSSLNVNSVLNDVGLNISVSVDAVNPLNGLPFTLTVTVPAETF